MKKIFSPILIFLILVNIFAPLSVNINKYSIPNIETNSAEGAGVKLKGETFANDTVITVQAEVVWSDPGIMTTQKVIVKIKNIATGQELLPEGAEINLTDKKDVVDQNGAKIYPNFKDQDKVLTQVGRTAFPGAKENTSYEVSIRAIQSTKNFRSIVLESTGGVAGIISYFTGITDPDVSVSDQVLQVKTNPLGQSGNTSQGQFAGASSDSFMPACWDGILPSIPGCAAQLIYYVLFIPTSYIFALTGQLFDWAFAYSVNDTSYRSPFVIEGWGLVRDFCNIFFIFVLLYVAFSTILNLHGPKPKEMIVNVIIIGLLINFSLFAAQIIIDTSNILARVFYNSDAIKITNRGANGVVNNTPGLEVGPDGVIPLSAALVNKVNPQNLIIKGQEAIVITDNVTGERSSAQAKGTLGTGAFILITLLAIAVNVIGIIVFLSVALMFIARVIGLWLAMVFVPLAFFSYTVPQMAGMKTVGWKHWWPETIKLAFMAPIFIFFLYVILKFLDTGLDLVNAASQTGTAFVIATVVPFAFIMVLLWKAKDLAKDLSGHVGQTITGVVAAAGGMALGGAALGTAALGRNIIGRGMAAASQSDSAKHLGTHKVALREYNTSVKEWKKNGSVGPVPVKPATAIAPAKGDIMKNGKPYNPNLFTGLGASLNAKQARIEKIDHEAHEIDDVKNKRYKGTEWNKLSGTQQNNVREDFIKENRSKFVAEQEEQFRSASGIAAGVPLTNAQRKIVTDNTTAYTGAKFDHILEEASKTVSGFARNLARVNTASFDARNISQMKANSRSGLFTKASAGLIAGIAMGVRTGLKTSNINHGSGQNDFLKDIGHTITEAMKSAKFNVKIEESHGTGGDDSHGGGGHH